MSGFLLFLLFLAWIAPLLVAWWLAWSFLNERFVVPLFDRVACWRLKLTPEEWAAAKQQADAERDKLRDTLDNYRWPKL